MNRSPSSRNSSGTVWGRPLWRPVVVNSNMSLSTNRPPIRPEDNR